MLSYSVVKNDFLDLAVPVWVSDLAFVPNSDQVAVCSRHGYIRLYDPKAGPRRPVVDCKPEDEAWNCIGISSRPNQVLVASGKGRVLLFDLRQMRTVHAYRGFTGGVREVFCHPVSPLIVSVGLDRFIRVHHLDSKAPVHKAYLKSRLNAIVVRKDFHLVDIDEQETHAVADKEASVATAASDSLWNEMEVICEEKGSPRKSRKRKA